MGRRDLYRTALRGLDARRWPEYLRENSGLPGPRGNIELAQAVADEGNLATFDRMIETDDEYLVFCGVIGLGRLLADGMDVLSRLRGHAVDARWRVREAVAMALQRLGDADLPRMLTTVTAWVDDPHPLVRRAAAAAVCEPRLLTTGPAAACAIEVCSRATEGLARLPSDRRRDPGVRSLRQALGYCWSVAVAADPVAGLPRFLALGDSTDRDVAWIVRENGKKARLARLL
ncbi:HEAT repeat domain-containing protein [Promicromonospora soli]